jgi:hypothetical protein
MDSKDDRVTEHDLYVEHRAALDVLSKLTREALASLVERLRSVGFVTAQLPARVCDWPRVAALTVYAEYRNQQERRK